MSISGAIAVWNTGERWRDNAPMSGSGFLASEVSAALNTILTPALMLNISVSSRLLGPGPNLAISVSLPYRFEWLASTNVARSF